MVMILVNMIGFYALERSLRHLARFLGEGPGSLPEMRTAPPLGAGPGSRALRGAGAFGATQGPKLRATVAWKPAAWKHWQILKGAKCMAKWAGNERAKYLWDRFGISSTYFHFVGLRTIVGATLSKARGSCEHNLNMSRLYSCLGIAAG